MTELDDHFETLSKDLWTPFIQRFDETSGIDNSQRFQVIAKSLQPIILQSALKIIETLTDLSV